MTNACPKQVHIVNNAQLNKMCKHALQSSLSLHTCGPWQVTKYKIKSFSAPKQMLSYSDSALACSNNELKQPLDRSEHFGQWDCTIFGASLRKLTAYKVENLVKGMLPMSWTVFTLAWLFTAVKLTVCSALSKGHQPSVLCTKGQALKS